MLIPLHVICTQQQLPNATTVSNAPFSGSADPGQAMRQKNGGQ